MKTKFEDLEIYQISEKFFDEIWDIVIKWENFPKNTLGMQFVDAADGIGSNIAEGSGKGSYAEFRRFVKISRGCLFETKHWLRRAYYEIKLTFNINKQQTTDYKQHTTNNSPLFRRGLGEAYGIYI